MAAAPPVAPLHAPGLDCCLSECPTRQTPDTRRRPLGHAPWRFWTVPPAHSTAWSPTTTGLPTGVLSAIVSQANVVSVVPGRLLFFSILGEIIRRRGLSQHPGDDLIGQAVKNLMNTSFQISKLRRMVSQLRHPLLLLILQLLLQLPQHFVNVRHHRPRRSFDTHFHTPPAIHRIHLSSVYARLTLSTDTSDDPFSGIGHRQLEQRLPPVLLHLWRFMPQFSRQRQR